MDSPKLTVSNQNEESISIQRVKKNISGLAVTIYWQSSSAEFDSK